MKNPLNTLLSATSLVAAGLLFAAAPARATNFPGNGSGDWGGEVGQGTLTVTDDGTNITFSLLSNGSSFGGNVLALYIDTGAAGYTNTAGFTATGNPDVNAIAGYDGSDRSVMTFTNGFTPSYAIAIQSSWMDLFGLASFNYITGNGVPSGNTYALTFPVADLGLTPGAQHTIKLFGSLLSNTAWRSSEAIPGNYTGLYGDGRNPFTQTAYATYTFDAPPTPSYPVTFSVDMSWQVALGTFNPGNGDTVYAAGSFQTNAWSGFQLTNNPSGANTNIYSGTYPDYNSTNAAEQFKFNFHSVSGGNSVWEGLDNRPFTLAAAGVTNALVYFDDVFPTNGSATTNNLTFRIDMGPQIYLGHFNPGAGDQIEVFGTLEDPKWSAGGLVLTNGTGTNANIYSGTIADGNYPGSFENYKYVIVTTGGNTYESYNGGANRTFFTPTGAYSFALADFNGVSNIYATPITFKVDMTAPLAAGTFNPTGGDVVYAAGTFQTNTWTPGAFVLTNGTGVNSNIYSGTYSDANQPGAGEQFKFVIITSGGVTNYEGLSGNRTFLLGSTAQTLPTVYWANLDPANVLLVPTTVTFTVDMTNAVDVFGNVFNPLTDVVMVDGDFTSPQWQVLGNATDPSVSGDFPNNVMTNNPIGSTFYSIQFVIPGGNPLALTYKYGINFNPSGINTNVDNEAGFAQNHVRYIRATGAYTLPVDTFGANRTNGAAVEASFGNLAIGEPTGNTLPITWLGRPGVNLQYTTNLSSGVWVNLSATSGTNASSWSTTNGTAYFRLVNP